MAEHKPGAGPQKTLERVISKAGLGSRTEARRWIHAGRVTVNGRRTENPDQWIDFDRDVILFDDRPLTTRERQYVLLYKPKGYLTTYKDPEGRPTVYDLLADITTFLSPVGRLDLDTSGLLILTNDTQFAERITNPDSHVPKTYLVKASTLLTDEQIRQLRSGVELNDGPTRPAAVNRVRDSGKYTHLEITLTEGRNRQVRRMVEAIGSHVLKLVRVQIGTVAIGTLPIGKWRPLADDEIVRLGGLPQTTRADDGAPGSLRNNHQGASHQQTRRTSTAVTRHQTDSNQGDARVSAARGWDSRTSEARGRDSRRSDSRGSESNGPAARGSDAAAWSSREPGRRESRGRWSGGQKTASRDSAWRGPQSPESASREPAPRRSQSPESPSREPAPRGSDARAVSRAPDPGASSRVDWRAPNDRRPRR